MNVLGRPSPLNIFLGRSGCASVARGSAGASRGCLLTGVAVNLFLAGEEGVADLLWAFAAIRCMEANLTRR
ncbi:hypothetical protein A1348_00125 [Pseudomonas protegens]|nr:hypothetical protein A1348_00125 [Pseudomonas protegens]